MAVLNDVMKNNMVPDKDIIWGHEWYWRSDSLQSDVKVRAE